MGLRGKGLRRWRQAVGRGVWAAVMVGFLGLSGPAKADPSREEAYRNDDLRIVVYKDGRDATKYWYLPPLRWLKRDGQLVWYKRPRDGRMDYFFYVVPYITDDLLAYIASELPNVSSQSQLQPLILKRLGIRVPQLDLQVLGTEASDFHYINSPQLMRLTLDPAKAEEFEFFMQNDPGLAAQVFFFYQAERVDRYIDMELSCHDVYESVRFGVQGRYQFLRGEIEDRMFEYITNKYLHIRSKGDIPMPDILNRAIAECFIPMQPPRFAAVRDEVFKDRAEPAAEGSETWNAFLEQFALYRSLVHPVQARLEEKQISNPTIPGVRPVPGSPSPGVPGPVVPGPVVPGPINPGIPGRPPGSGPGIPGNPGTPGSGDGVLFSFREDMANVTRSFFFSREQVSNSEELSAVPMTLSFTNDGAPPTDVVSTPYPSREFVVAHTNDANAPLVTGIQVRPGDQLLITSSFSVYVESAYGESRRQRIRFDSAWGNPDEQLFYRVGTGPWTAVNGRALIRTDSITGGSLELYQDRSRIWEMFPREMRRGRFLLPAVLQYRTTYPQFDVTVTGRHVSVAPGRP